MSRAERASPARWILVGCLGLLLSLVPAPDLFAQSGTAPATPPVKLEVPPKQGGQLIKTIQRKNFLKVKRLEMTAFLGGETIDPFLYHWVGGINGTYHLTEVFAIEGLVGYSPYLGDSDLKDLTLELAQTASLKPLSSKMGLYGHAGLVFSPLYGKMAFMSNRIVNFDIYFMSGFGAVSTQDLSAETDDESSSPMNTKEVHFATNFGFGFRAAFNQWMAFKLEGREYFYVESVSSETQEVLNLKYYFIAQAGVSFFFPTTLR